MPVSGTDPYGTFLDTGINTAVTVRASVEVEVHLPAEVDSGSKILPPVLPTTHSPHRELKSPR